MKVFGQLFLAFFVGSQAFAAAEIFDFICYTPKKEKVILQWDDRGEPKTTVNVNANFQFRLAIEGENVMYVDRLGKEIEEGQPVAVVPRESAFDFLNLHEEGNLWVEDNGDINLYGDDGDGVTTIQLVLEKKEKYKKGYVDARHDGRKLLDSAKVSCKVTPIK